MYAIIKTGGKQYRVQKDDEFKIEKLYAEVGDTVTFDEILAVSDKTLEVGTPFVSGYSVKAEVVENGKNDKVIIYKYKAKKNYRNKNGHRQPYTMVKITDICKSEKVESADKAEANLSMKKAELLEIADSKNIDVNAKATKAEIFEAIKAVK